MLVQKGLEWLKGREDRFDWAPVWEKLIENPLGLKGPGLDTGSLLALGVAWLDGRQARSDWSFVYETALKQGVCDEHFLEMGVIWCRSNAKRPETWGIAQELLIAFNQEANDMIRHSFIDWVAKELESRPTHKSWTFLWGALWRIDPTPNTLNLALLWIEHIPPDRQVTWVLNTALGPSTPAVLETAVQWCVAHPSLRSSWSAAVILLRAYVPKANDVPQQFKNWVANILKQSPENPSWTSVWGALREVEPTIETAKLIIPWLANASKPAPITWAVRTLLKSSEGELMRAELERWVVENPSQYAASVIKSALSAAARESLRDCKNAPDAEKDAELL